MKKIISITCALIVLNICKAQYVPIPDTAFVNYLQSTFPLAMAGNMMDTTSPWILSPGAISIHNSNIKDITGIRYFDNLTVLDLSRNDSLRRISELPPSLLGLYLYDSPIDSLPPLPATLINLELRNANIINWPAFPSNLYTFVCDTCGLSVLPPLPITLGILRVAANSLTSIPSTFTSLIGLNVSDNQITNLPPLPPTLTSFICSDNQLTSIPALPSPVYGFDCSRNPINVLPSLSIALQGLSCSGCGLTNLPALPPNVVVLDASNNFIQQLPVLPNGIQHLLVSNNQITSLSSLPQSLIKLDCSNNLITQIDSFPQNLYFLDCSNNQLGCLPQLPDRVGFETGRLLPNPVVCLPNYTSWMVGEPSLFSIPLCLPMNVNSCPTVSAIYGSTILDINNDCIGDNNDSLLNGIPLTLYNSAGTQIAQTSSSTIGNFIFTVPIGAYELSVDTTGLSFLNSCSGGLTRNLSLTTSTPIIQNENFQLFCNGSYDPGIKTGIRTGLVFPSLNHEVRFVAGDLSQLYGASCGAGNSGQLIINFTGAVSYQGNISGCLIPVVSGNSLTYNISDFAFFDTQNAIGLIFQTDQTAQIGDTIYFSVIISGGGIDANPSNNIFYFEYPVVNSYDPNMKEVFPSVVQPGYLDYLLYTVHFQNNGTAPALNISVVDELSAMLDSSTFEFISASHNYTWTLTGRRLSVLFKDINLVDSATNYSESQGWFQFKIKPSSVFPGGTIIPNYSAIYFDFNSPIYTNVAEVNYSLPIGISNTVLHKEFIFFPNPASSNITVVFPEYSEPITQITISDFAGRICLTEQVSASGSVVVSTEQLDAGCYIINAYINGIRFSKPLIISRN